MIPETPAGEIDYLAHWRNLVEARVDQGRRLDTQHSRADEWAGDRANRFRRIVAHTFHDDPLSEHLRPLLRPDDVLLDVGAGPGRHAIPLANLVRRVVAVEPSAAMRSHLIDGIDRADRRNVDVVAAGWPEAEVAPADVVICSHVVYGVADLGPFLQKLDAVARRHCTMVLRYGQREEPILDLFRQIWGERRCLAPTCLDLLGALAQLGIRANLRVVPFGAGYHFASLDEAVRMVQADLLNPTSPEVERLIREDLAARLIPADDGFSFPRGPAYAGIFWWDK